MGGGDLLGILIQTIKSKMTGIVTKVRLYTNWSFIKNKVITKIREFFSNLLGFKPRDKYDYYTIGRWMVSKRFAYASVIIVGVVSIWYISTETTLFKNFSEEGVPTYKYNSLRLRVAKGHVRITGKGGYLAFDGNVEGGYVNGSGTLYNKEGNTVYTGDFSRSMYEGTGTENYNSGNIKYYGSFHKNLYDGDGVLYREDGTRIYDGSFSGGLKNGTGTLYDNGENVIFEGAFSNDEIVFSEFLGKSVVEVNDCYKGHKDMYTTPTESVAVMNSIGALYHATVDTESLDGDEIVDSVYILSDTFKTAGKEYSNLTDVEKALGDSIYQGNSNVILPEAVAINLVNQKKRALSGTVSMDLDYSFSDVAQVKNYNREYVVYITSFKREDVIYSFVSGQDDNMFEFYYITGAEDEDM